MGKHHTFVMPRDEFARRPGDERLDADELAELAAEDAREACLEDMAEIAAHNRSYAEGDWSLDDWLEWSPVGRGYAAAHERSVAGMVA